MYIVFGNEDEYGAFAIGTTPEEAFNNFKDYHDEYATFETVSIYELGQELTGKVEYTFTPVGT